MSAEATTAFQREIIDLIRRHYPSAIHGDVEQNATCSAELATALGAMLAFAFRLNGEVICRTVLQTIVSRIVENATAIHPKSGEAIRSALPTMKVN